MHYDVAEQFDILVAIRDSFRLLPGTAPPSILRDLTNIRPLAKTQGHPHLFVQIIMLGAWGQYSNRITSNLLFYSPA